MKNKLIIFDCDGTVLNTYDLIQKVVYATFNKLFPTYNLTKEEAQAFFGPYLKDSFKKYVKTDQEIKQCIECYQTIYNTLSKEYTKVYDGILDLLKYLHNNGYKIAMVSNKASKAVIMGLTDCGIYSYFDLIIGAEMMEKAKPDPGGIKKVQDYFNIQEGLMIGDTTIDIMTGQNANLLTVGVTWCVTKEQAFKEIGADYIINHPHELINILEEI